MTKKLFGAGYHQAFQKNQLTLGIGFPIEAYDGPIATLNHQIERVQAAEKGGFAVAWCRDIPVLDPSFGDLGQIFDPWVWLSHIAAHTSRIGLGTGSIILPLRAAADTAKAAASVDQLSQGRLVCGVATGDRPVEYSVFNESFDDRGERFVETLGLIKELTHKPEGWRNQHAAMANALNVLPKAYAGDIPFLVTGNSRQSIEWIAEHADGWLMYPRPLSVQQATVQSWRNALSKSGHDWKPFAQSLYIDIVDDPNAAPTPIHLGFRLGRNALIQHLESLRGLGVNHVFFNVKFSGRSVDEVLAELVEYVVPEFKI